MFLFNLGEAPKMPEPIQIVIEQKVEEPKEEETLQYKIDNDVNNCEPERYIRADNAECGEIRPEYRQTTSSGTQSHVATTNTSQTAIRASSGANSYSYGYCTHWVASKRYVPNGWGNAISWKYYAQYQGWTVSSQPIVGAIAYEPTGGYGHVAFVESVNGTTVTVSEKNYKGWNVVSYRTVPISQFTYLY